jgi:hypothetical protein
MNIGPFLRHRTVPALVEVGEADMENLQASIRHFD